MREIKFNVWYEDAKQMISAMIFNIDSVNNDGGIWLQYTGLKDNADKEVYEGDVISFNFRTKHDNAQLTGRVYFDEFMWCVETIEGEIFSINRITSVSLLGNIYENTELIA